MLLSLNNNRGSVYSLRMKIKVPERKCLTAKNAAKRLSLAQICLVYSVRGIHIFRRDSPPLSFGRPPPGFFSICTLSAHLPRERTVLPKCKTTSNASWIGKTLQFVSASQHIRDLRIGLQVRNRVQELTSMDNN